MPDVQSFINEWLDRPGRERGNLQPFILGLCEALGLPKPGASAPGAEYCFAAPVATVKGTGQAVTKEMDLYKKGCFVLEGKQIDEKKRRGRAVNGKASKKVFEDAAELQLATYDKAVAAAFGQAVGYAETMALTDGKAPFVIVCDVGFGFHIWNSFYGDYGRYASRRFIPLRGLADPDVQDYLRAIWTDPYSLDPRAVSAAVTREIAAGLGGLRAKLMEAEPDARRVARFLMRVVFTLFAESIGLLPKDTLLSGIRFWEEEPDEFQAGLDRFWAVMDAGGIFGHRTLQRFNGHLFSDTEALRLTRRQIKWLRGIAEKQWKDVDPSIFGALLEGALDPAERKRHGVHYTPKAHIQRLIDNTFGNELWAEWSGLHDRAQALLGREQGLDESDEAKGMKAELAAFRQKLGRIKILDPACGSGNFLYVAFDTLKRIEEEIIVTLELFGVTRLAVQSGGDVVTPANLMGMELDAWAASIAELVLWIAYIQWYCRLFLGSPDSLPIPEPVLQNYGGIEQRDAVLAWADTKETGRTRWGGKTIKSGRTGKAIPDPGDRVSILEYMDPKPAEWPKADYIVGNPPFLGNARLREMLGDGYAEALRAAYPDVPDSVDLVMYWWHRAALEVRHGRARRFGLITTNSITQVRQRGVVAGHLEPAAEPPALKILWAVADHPWGGTVAKARIAMTVGGLDGNPRVAWVTDEGGGDTPEERADSVVLAERDVEAIHADLRTGVDVDAVVGLRANHGLASRGVLLIGDGFRVSEERWDAWGRPDVVRPCMNGRDLVERLRGLYVIDLYGLSEDDVKRRYPQIWQHLYDTVKPERDQNNDPESRANWWIFGRPRNSLRLALDGLARFIVTVETAKHRVFTFLDAGVLPDNKLIVLASDDAYVLAVLSSKIHKVWFAARCGRLGRGEVYNKTTCFDTFPFPDAPEEQKAEIRALGEGLDAHVKGAQDRGATITETYNLVELLKSDANTKLNAAQRLTHQRAATDVLLGLHKKLDAAVAKAYGWPNDLSDEDTLARLTALNAERAKEEAEGRVRWLRPEYQAKDRGE